MQVRLSILSLSLLSDGDRDCFVAYVTTKIVKQTEDFKVRYTTVAQPRKVLLPLSLGLSSLALLNLLDEHYSRQLQKANRTGFELLVLCITDNSSDPRLAVQAVSERFSSHTYKLIPLHDIFRYHPNLHELVSTDERREHSPDASSLEAMTPEEKLAVFLSSFPSASSKGDLISILRLRLIVALAKENGCDCITWGDSTTRLAEETLSATAKGRGFSVPWQTGDGQSPYGIEFKFPMRSLLRKEIVQYSRLTSPALTSLVVDESQAPSTSVSSKDLTIDALMGRYFASVENNYPSIVANVVRTANRLEAPRFSSVKEPCDMCGMPFEVRTNSSNGETDQGPEPLMDAIANGVLTKRFCHGCSTSLLVR